MNSETFDTDEHLKYDRFARMLNKPVKLVWLHTDYSSYAENERWKGMHTLMGIFQGLFHQGGVFTIIISGQAVELPAGELYSLFELTD